MRVEPNIGDEVYVTFKTYNGAEIAKAVVYAKSKETFLLEGYNRMHEEVMEWRFDDYGLKWFDDLDCAIDEMLYKCGDDYDVEFVEENLWWVRRIKK
jgi:uncharacterized protein YxjI